MALTAEQEDEVRAELLEALGQVGGVERRIALKQNQEKVQQGRRRIKALADDIRDALHILGVDTLPDTGGDGGNGDGGNGDGGNGGGDSGNGHPAWPEPGEHGREVVEGLEVTAGGRFKLRANTDYVEPKFYATEMVDLDNNSLPDGVRFFRPVFERISGAHVLYINMGHEEREIGFGSYGARFIRCSAPNVIEVKGSLFEWLGATTEGCKYQQFYRGRHGRKQTLIGYTGEGEVSMRGWLQYVDACPKARGVAWAGNGQARAAQWLPQHKPGNAQQQCTELSFFGAMASVEIGHLGQPNYPALNNFVGPEMEGRVRLSRQTGTKVRRFGGPRELWSLAA